MVDVHVVYPSYVAICMIVCALAHSPCHMQMDWWVTRHGVLSEACPPCVASVYLHIVLNSLFLLCRGLLLMPRAHIHNELS